MGGALGGLSGKAAGGGVATRDLTDPDWCPLFDLSDSGLQQRPGVPRWPDQKPVHPKKGV